MTACPPVSHSRHISFVCVRARARYLEHAGLKEGTRSLTRFA